MKQIDQYLVDKIPALQEAGFVTASSCSGLPEDHDEEGYVIFFILFIIESKDLARIDKVKHEAMSSGFSVDEKPFFVGQFGYYNQTKFKRCRCIHCRGRNDTSPVDPKHQELVELIVRGDSIEKHDLKTSITSFVSGLLA